MQLTRIPLHRLVPTAGQPRTSTADPAIHTLKASIAQHGLLQPLRVRPADADGRHTILCGHRRHAALELLGVEDVPCLVVDNPLDEADALAEQLAENVHRENLSPIEEAHGYRRYLELRCVPASQAAQQLAVSPTRLSRLLALLELPEPIRAAVHTGQLSADTAYHLSRLPDGDTRDHLLAQALAGTLSRDDAVRAVKTARQKPTESAGVTRASLKLPHNHTLTVCGPAIVLESFIATLEDVLREARKARGQGFDLSTLTKMFRDRAAKGAAS